MQQYCHVVIKKSGKAEVVRQGVLAALSTNIYRVGFWEADLATPLSEISSFRQYLSMNEDVKMISGARVKDLEQV